MATTLRGHGDTAPCATAARCMLAQPVVGAVPMDQLWARLEEAWDGSQQQTTFRILFGNPDKLNANNAGISTPEAGRLPSFD